MLKQSIGFIGAGNMATALGQGFVRAKLAKSARICWRPILVNRPETNSLRLPAAQVGSDNIAVAGKSDVLFLAVKPQYMAAVAGELAGKIPAPALVVSIAAGVRLSRLAGWLGEEVRLVRVMPNTPCLIGEGACGYCLGDRATPEDGELVGKLLEAVGTAWQVEEKMLDAVTGLSGSGPAFIYVIIEALSDAGVRSGPAQTYSRFIGR